MISRISMLDLHIQFIRNNDLRPAYNLQHFGHVLDFLNLSLYFGDVVDETIMQYLVQP
jgi:hypothetical protein